MEEVQILKARGRVRKTKLLVWKASADFTGEERKYNEIKQLSQRNNQPTTELTGT